MNELILKAHRLGASDLHLEPHPDHLLVRVRTDGSLQVLEKVPHDQAPVVMGRLKIMASMDTGQSRLPTDGRFPFGKYEPQAKELDIRLTFLPTFFGEKAVLRLIDHSKLKLSLDELGFTPDNARHYQQLIARPSGLLLHVGPQGCGKTTTAYTALKSTPRPQASVVTVEETIEYVLPGVTQVQLNAEFGLDYAKALQGVLRQDPDVVLVGEIRDAETARVAMEAAMSGRLLISTLHATGAASAVGRLVELGFSRAQIAHALAGIVSQRLVRRLCVDCREKVSPSTLIRSALVLPPQATTVYKPKGCRKCGNKGFRGRVAVIEVVAISDRLREAVVSGAPAATLDSIAASEGTIPLLRDAVEKVLSGATAVEEVLRALCGVAVDDVSAITEPGEMVNFLKTVRDQFLPPGPPPPPGTPIGAGAASATPPASPAPSYSSAPSGAFPTTPPQRTRPATTGSFPAAMLDEPGSARPPRYEEPPRPPSGQYRLPDDLYRGLSTPQVAAKAPDPRTASSEDLLRNLMNSLPPEVAAQIARAAASGVPPSPSPAPQPAVPGTRPMPPELIRQIEELKRRLGQV